MHYYKVLLSVILVICLIFCPICTKVKANPVIGGFVIGLFLSVAISLGFYFEINDTDISAWVEAKIQAFLQANGYQSIEAWLGANFEAEASVSGTFLGLTPNLYAKIKAAVEFCIGNSNDDLPQGGSESSPVARSLLSNYYLPCEITIPGVGTFTGDYPIINWESIANRSPDYQFVNSNSRAYRYEYNTFPLSFSTSLATDWTDITIISNNLTYTYSYYINSIKITNNNLSGTLSLGNRSNSCVKVPINCWNMEAYYANSQYPIQLVFIPRNGSYQNLVPALIYKAINGYTYLCCYLIQDIPSIPAFSNGNGDITAFSVGQPGYTFNNADLIYIDLQLGQLNSALQALLALIAAINDNLVTWTIALQTTSPGDLPVDTTPLIDFVDYCNEQTNLYLSGTSTLANTVGNMYQQLYTTLSGIQSAPLSDACINTYNAFINKLTLFSNYNAYNTNITVVDTFSDYCNEEYRLFNNGSHTLANALANTNTRFTNALNNATTIQEIIGLCNVYSTFLDRLGINIEKPVYVTTAISSLNDITDNYLSGSIDRGTALSSLLSTYKNSVMSCVSASDIAQIITAYQACLDRISLEDLSIDPDGLGDTADEVISMEDDLLSHIDLDELSVMLDFQNWTYINASEGTLYREFFQKLMDSNSPFYLFIYVPMILGIVGIVLGTRVTLPHKVKESHDDSITVNPNYDRYHSDYTGRGT